MWPYFGGVTPYVVIDNLKSGVKRAHRYDPDVNPTYCDYAAHAGFAVLPARPYKPKDKAVVEVTISVIQRQFYQDVRNREFYSLSELNAAFSVYLKRLNAAVMKDYGVSRKERFMSEVRLLKSGPKGPFEFSERKTAKVHPDCHIQVHRNFYSVPYQNVGQVVRVRITEKLVEIFSKDGEPTAVHARILGKGRFSTDLRHYPQEQQGVRRFELKHAQQDAEKIGPKTTELVESLISSSYPLRYLRRIQGILRLAQSNRVSPRSLEYAAAQALLFNKPRLNYKRSENILPSYESSPKQIFSSWTTLDSVPTSTRRQPRSSISWRRDTKRGRPSSLHRSTFLDGRSSSKIQSLPRPSSTG